MKKFQDMQTSHPTAEAMKRITSDLKEALRANNGGMFAVLPHRKDITYIEALLIGKKDCMLRTSALSLDLNQKKKRPRGHSLCWWILPL